MKRRIRLTNPIKQCMKIQGKGYTALLIASIVAAVILCGVAAWGGMYLCATIYGIIAVGSTIGFGLWFGAEPIPTQDEDWD